MGSEQAWHAARTLDVRSKLRRCHCRLHSVIVVERVVSLLHIEFARRIAHPIETCIVTSIRMGAWVLCAVSVDREALLECPLLLLCRWRRWQTLEVPRWRAHRCAKVTQRLLRCTRYPSNYLKFTEMHQIHQCHGSEFLRPFRAAEFISEPTFSHYVF